MKKKILCTMMSMVMVASLFAGCGTDSGKENSASDTSKTKEAGTTISVAAIETAYGSEMWQKVADAFTEETGIKVELTTDKKLEDVIGPSMQGGEYPDVIHLATGREAALTEQFIKGHMITDITDVLSMKVPGEDKLVSEKIAGGFTDTSLTNPCNGVQREHNKKLNNGLPILHKVPPKRDYGRYFCIMAEKGGTSHGGLTEKLSPFFHAKKQEVNAYGR